MAESAHSMSVEDVIRFLNDPLPGGLKPEQIIPTPMLITEKWHQGFPINMRNCVLRLLIQGIFPHSDPSVAYETRLYNVVSNAQKLEVAAYETAKSKSDYLRVLLEKINESWRDFEKERKERMKQQQLLEEQQSQKQATQEFDIDEYLDELMPSFLDDNIARSELEKNQSIQQQQATQELDINTYSLGDLIPPCLGDDVLSFEKCQPIQQQATQEVDVYGYIDKEMSLFVEDVITNFEFEKCQSTQYQEATQEFAKDVMPDSELKNCQQEQATQEIGVDGCISEDMTTTQPENSMTFGQELLQWCLYARNCQRVQEQQANGEKCQLQNCVNMKNLLNHMSSCDFDDYCMVPLCYESRQVLTHFENCDKSDCFKCMPFKQTDKTWKQVENIHFVGHSFGFDVL